MSFEPEDGDIWGMVCPAWTGSALMYAAEQTMTEKDASDRPVLRLDDARERRCMAENCRDADR